MNRKPRSRAESLFSGGVGVGAVWQGAMIGVLTLIAYYFGFVWNSGMANTMAFATLGLSQLVHAVNMRSSHSLFRIGIRSNLSMVGAFFGSLALLLAVLLIPGVQDVFSLVPLTLPAWGVVLGLAVMPLVIMEVYKLIRWLCNRK